jgi:hypothetical protein
MNLPGKSAGQGLGGTARGGLGAGVDQVGNRFGLGQINFVIQNARSENSPGCASRRPGTRALAPDLAFWARFQAAGQQQLQHHRTTMRLQLQHILTGKGVRRREIQRQPLVNRLPLLRRKNGR